MYRRIHRSNYAYNYIYTCSYFSLCAEFHADQILQKLPAPHKRLHGAGLDPWGGNLLRATNRTAIPSLSTKLPFSPYHNGMAPIKFLAVIVKPAAQSSFFLSCFILKIEALAYSKRGLTICQSTRRNVSQNLQHHCENFKVPRCSVIVTVSWTNLKRYKSLSRNLFPSQNQRKKLNNASLYPHGQAACYSFRAYFTSKPFKISHTKGNFVCSHLLAVETSSGGPFIELRGQISCCKSQRPGDYVVF